MAGRTRLLSVEQGHDPRDFVLVIFGGAGPLHGASIMREVGIRTMLIPPHPGVLCALGCAIADIRYDLSQTVERPRRRPRAGLRRGDVVSQRRDGEAQLRDSERRSTEPSSRTRPRCPISARFTPCACRSRADWSLDRIVDAFQAAYRREYGNTLGDLPAAIVSLKTAVQGVRAQPGRIAAANGAETRAVPAGRRPVYFGGWIETPIFDRDRLGPGDVFDGPAIIEQGDTTSVIEPGMHARVDGFGNILVELA
jgi:N-methylhydantoinase A